MTLATAGQVVVIGSVPVGSALRAQLDAKPNTKIFSEADSLRALETIVADVPQLIALDPQFAATARGAALVARVKADPRLSGSEIRALVSDPEGEGLLSAPIGAGDQSATTVLQPLDRCGTRRATRFPMNSDAEARVNGSPARLVNLSVTGAQVLAPLRLRPAEGIRLTLVDESAELRVGGVVAWVTLEIAKGAESQRYRFGVEFRSADPQTLERYCLRYRDDSGYASGLVM